MNTIPQFHTTRAAVEHLLQSEASLQAIRDRVAAIQHNARVFQGRHEDDLEALMNDLAAEDDE